MPGLLDEPYPQGYGTGLLGYGNPVVYRGAIIPLVETADGTTGWGWPQMALDAYQALKAPGDVWQGKLDPRSQEGQERAMNLAGLLTLGSGAIPKPAGAFAMGTSNVGKPMAAPQIMKRVEPRPADIVGDRSLFDYSRLNEIPPVPQVALPRYEPPRGVSERLLEATNNPKVTAGINKGLDQGIKEGGHFWYNTEPLREAYNGLLGSGGDEAYKQFMNYTAATSPSSRVPINIRIASYYDNLARAGRDLSKEGVPVKGSGYGSKAQNLHLQNAQNYQSGNWEVLQNPKPLSFVENLSGNFAPVTVDTHAFRPFGMLSQDPRFIATSSRQNVPGGGYKDLYPKKDFEAGKFTMAEALERPAIWDSVPRPNEYAAVENTIAQLSSAKGLAPAQGQAASWVGLRGLTGMDSPPLPFLAIYEDVIKKSAEKMGVTPTQMLEMVIRAETPLK